MLDGEGEFERESLARSETLPVMVPIAGVPAGPALGLAVICGGVANQTHSLFWGLAILIAGGAALRVIAYSDPWALRIFGIFATVATITRRGAKLFGGASLDPHPIRPKRRTRRIRDAL